MANTPIPCFDDSCTWTAITSGDSRLAISQESLAEGPALRLDFDLRGGGFVVARRPISLTLPETYALALEIRGVGPRNTLELKLVDPSGHNVWWHRLPDFELTEEWRRLQIRSSQIAFAWGPAGGGVLRQFGAIELAIVAGAGGQGSVELRDLQIEDRVVLAAPIIRASSTLEGHAPDGLLEDPRSPGWRSEPSEPQWLTVDFQGEREHGGLVLHWAPDGRASAFEVQTSHDGSTWTTVYSATQADTERSHVYMPNTCARHLRLGLQRSVEGRGFGLLAIDVRPYEFSRSIQSFFQGVARLDQHRGSYPRYLHGEQSYWTPVGLPDGQPCALINEEGMVEVDQGSFSIEPFLFADDHLVSWADGEPEPQLEPGGLPIPSSVWRAQELLLRTTAYAVRAGDRPLLFIRYRVENASPLPRAVRLFAACRPFQVTPPWQAFGELGGVTRITDIERIGNVVWIDHAKAVLPLAAAAAFGVAAFEQQPIVEHLRKGEVPPRERVSDAFGHASAVLRFDLDLAPSSARDVHLAIPFGPVDAQALGALPPLDGQEAFQRAVRQWQDKLGSFDVELPKRWQDYADTMRSAVAHILLNRDGPALQPGPRRYTRCWIRDGAIMAAALLRTGCASEAQQFVRWYAGYQAEDGKVPCAVDRGGPDWLVEHDSHGEFIYAIADIFRFTRDRSFLEEMWPAVRKAVDCIETLRATRLGPEYEAVGLRARRGLLPESASHEGYLAQPVHAYWDDFWAVRALGDAAFLAGVLGEQRYAQALIASRDDFRGSVRESMRIVMDERGIEYVPGSVEWADFDPSATANAVSPLGELGCLPHAALEHTFARCLERLRQRRKAGADWKDYTAYEVRIVGALVRMGDRVGANELADFLLGDRRPMRWNQWPEISWRDPRSPGHIGDVPHSWIGAEYVLAFRTMLAYERETDDALVLAAGVPAEWLDEGDVAVRNLATCHGTLDFTLRRVDAASLSFALGGDLAPPPGGIVLQPPLPRPLVAVEIDGQSLGEFQPRSVTLHTCPAKVLLRY